MPAVPMCQSVTVLNCNHAACGHITVSHHLCSEPESESVRREHGDVHAAQAQPTRATLADTKPLRLRQMGGVSEQNRKGRLIHGAAHVIDTKPPWNRPSVARPSRLRCKYIQISRCKALVCLKYARRMMSSLYKCGYVYRVRK